MDACFTVVFALYPGVTQLDFTAPYEVFVRLPNARCLLASVSGGAIRGDGEIEFGNVRRLGDIDECQLICVPGGYGTVDALTDDVFLGELQRLATRATWVTSVCTGSLLLAAAGLLRGKRAACHWAWRDSLAEFGVTVDPERVVCDGNVITGGGVTAGIDMALTVMSRIAGEDFAQTIQLALEYAPAPPYECGRPELARPEIVSAASKRLDTLHTLRNEAVRQAVERMTKTYES